MGLYQGVVIGEIIIGGIQAKVRIGNGGMRHFDRVNDLLKERRGVVVRVDVVNGGDGMGEKKSEIHCLFNQKRSTNHMMNNLIT